LACQLIAFLLLLLLLPVTCCQLLLLLPDLCDNFSSTSTHMRSGFRMRAGYEPLLQPYFAVAAAFVVGSLLF